MDRARFEALAQAYGADLRRWPPAERASADDFVIADPQAARAALAAAEPLDDLLHASRNPVPSPELRASVLAGAPKPRRAAPRFGFWLSGASLAAAGVAGVMVGVSMAGGMVADARVDAMLADLLMPEATEVLPMGPNWPLEEFV